MIKRFARLGEMNLTAIVMDVSQPQNTEDPPDNPGHPACGAHAGSDYCRESWQLHLAELKRRPESHWHKCDYGMLCAVVPVVWEGSCVAAVKIASSEVKAEKQFAGQVELLDLLIKEFVTRNVDLVKKFRREEARALSFQDIEDYFERRPDHPQIVAAVRAIKQRLADPKLSVAQVATDLKMDPSYLSHLFVAEVGQRMSRFITARRVESAKKLLATTHWQVKRIAQQTGHANANWFCHVFRMFTGVTPGAYRHDSRAQSRRARRR